MRKWKGKPLYDMIVDLKSKDSGVNRLDFVTRPANKMPLMIFDEEGGETAERFDFSEKRRLVTFVIMQPDFPIIRRDKDGNEFYVQFSKETIETMRDKFMIMLKLHERGAQHEVKLTNLHAPMVETWIVDKERGISAPEKLQAPDGTWMGTARILDDTLWSSVEDGTFEGISLEGMFDMYEMFSDIDLSEENNENFDSIVKNVIFSKKSVFQVYNTLKEL